MGNYRRTSGLVIFSHERELQWQLLFILNSKYRMEVGDFIPEITLTLVSFITDPTKTSMLFWICFYLFRLREKLIIELSILKFKKLSEEVEYSLNTCNLFNRSSPLSLLYLSITTAELVNSTKLCGNLHSSSLRFSVRVSP